MSFDNDDINEAWMLLKNAITQTTGTILNRIERVTHKDWFDVECEQATLSKNKAYKRMQQRNHTRKAVEEYRTARREEKRVHKQNKKTFIGRGLEELERRDKEEMFLSEEDDILRRWAEYYDELPNIEFSNQNATSQNLSSILSH